jgi:hypothetical protein
MRKSSKTKLFFPRIEWEEEGELAALGYFPVVVSVFDHHLTDDEYPLCDILFYRLAERRGKLAEYMVGEQQFLALYRDLASEGAYIKKGGRYWFADADDKDFIALQVRNLRDGRHLDAYFIGPQIRLFGTFDRNDLFLLRDKAYLPELEKKVREHGLYTLPSGWS